MKASICDRRAAQGCALGYVQRTSVIVELRWASGDYNRLPELAHKLLARNVKVVLRRFTTCV